MIELITKIESKDDFIYFLKLLSKDFEKNLNEWTNKTIPEFLEQMVCWVEDYSISPINDIKWDTIQFQALA